MLALILLIDLIAIYLAWRTSHRERDWRESVLAAAVIWGTLVALSTELLGLFYDIERQTVFIFWLVVFIVTLIIIIRQRQRISLKPRLPQLEDMLAWAMVSVIALYVAITFLVAIIAPPNTNDATQYHMSRVMHWIVNHSVAFYPTPGDRQLWMPPFAEYAILHFQLLARNDTFANLVQWLSMFGTAIGVSLIASCLGARQKGQLFAAMFAVTLPMGVLQSTGAQTDYVTAFWGVCLAYFVISESARYASESTGGLSINSVLLALVFGLGVLTKGTFIACAVPILLWLLVILIWKKNWKIMSGLMVLGLVALLLLSGSLWWRNYHTYRNPLGPAVGTLGSTVFTPAAVFSTALRNAAAQMAFDSGPANKILYLITQKVHTGLRIDISDPRTTLGEYRIRHSVHEDFAGNNWHFIFSTVAIIFVFVVFIGYTYRRRTERRSSGPSSNGSGFSYYVPLLYAITVSLSYILFSGLFKWQDTNSRLLMPWFLITTPIVGWVFDRINRYIQIGIVILLTLSSLTVLVSNPSRPLIASGENESILTASRTTTLFNNSPEIKDDYISVVITARDLECKSIGLELDSNTPEYLIWAILSPSGQDLLNVEHLLAQPETVQYATTDYRPCAVICNICKIAQEKGYEKVYDRGSLKLYIQPSP
jgi:hypothetical protein